MASLIITDRIVAFLPNSAQGQSQDALAAFEQDCKKLGLRIIENGQFLFACNVLTEKEDRGAEETLVLDIFPGTAASGRPFERLSDMPNWAAHHEFLEQEAQCYNLFCLRPNRLELESDQLGLKPLHFANPLGGRLLFSRILDGLKVSPALTTPVDRTAIHQLITSRTTIPDRTIHEKIRRVPTGLTVGFQAGKELRWQRTRRLQAPALRPTILSENVFEETITGLKRSVHTKTENLSHPLYIALSGGFDSRLIAAVCADEALQITAASFGKSHHPELRNAKAVSGELGLPLETIDYETSNTIKSLPLHLEVIEGTADLSTSSVANLFKLGAEFGSSVLHGFIGEALAGQFLSLLQPGDLADHETLAAALRNSLQESLTESAKLLGGHESIDEIATDIENGLVTDAEPHQAYTIWNLENRQRRYTATTLSIIAQHFDPTLPYYDRSIMETWLSLPPIALEGRSLFKKMLAERYPRLARIPHPEEGLPIVPNLEHQLKTLWHSTKQRILIGALGEKWASGALGRLNRDPYIWSLANLTAPRQQEYMANRVSELRHVTSEVLGLDISGEFQQITARNVQARRALYMISEYASRLKTELDS